MRLSHKNVFWKVAQSNKCWIILREPNVLSEKWIGKPGYKPKALTCKAKSADKPGHKFSGLVVDPTKCPEAFTSRNRQTAIETWKNKFLNGGRLPGNYTSTDQGLVKHHGNAIYADFDLMSLSKSNDQGEFLFTEKKDLKKLFTVVARAINRGLGVPMIQHGPEFLFMEGVGARVSENVLFFGPGRRFTYMPSSMPVGGH
jgi:hypothetical protein